MENTILGPASVLVLWSLIMLIWMAGTRLPALAKKGVDLKTAQPGARGPDLEGMLTPKVNWKSHNYTHLMEQPTLFYAAVGILALSGHGGGTNTTFAWGYVILRIAHSLWQSLVNTILVRFTLFLLSTMCLFRLAVACVHVTLFGG
jgi:uncharacterized MAPEG superfamily protein